MLRPLYGQADAGRIWQRTIHAQFVKQGFTRSEYDPCYYFKHYPDGTFMGCCLYVDDGFCDMDVHCPGGEADMRELASAFDIKVKENTDYFLGTNVTYKGRLGHSQVKHSLKEAQSTQQHGSENQLDNNAG